MSNQLTTFSNVYANSSPPPPIPESSPIASPIASFPIFYSPKPPLIPPIDFVGDPLDFEAEGANFLPVACLF